MYALIGLLAIVALFLSARRAITIVELQCDRGKLRVLRGGIAPRLLADLEDVVARPPIGALHIRVTRDSGRAAIVFRGERSSGQEQQIRNVIGSVPLAKLMNRRTNR